MEELKMMRNVYEEPKLEVVKFSVEEKIMFIDDGSLSDDGEFPTLSAGGSFDDENPFPQ